ncbi:pectate lyase [Pectobacterium odoriferum]|uniref:Pectate lyase n=1 Tax=Pectobacterium odoriferum TaxID=78398 RepID=A0ABD6VU98_9GAMM|nr:pectate lyase PelI [Pectobacterium odoriferum]POD97765.1 pectate lyase [Pectobacterium odoriferum]POE14061.1 pectate lyase [Pectobacterium odoriferum]POE27730.1 pectate lyase [Pectobacterium odoriferum]POE32512.1 pectate lyase [Pectobacterium odoriferum]POE42229.1 pectate lyase [Pectobacterium odoriferum]
MFKYLTPIFLCTAVISFQAQADDTMLMLLKKDNATYLSWSTDAGNVVRQDVYRSTSSAQAGSEKIAELNSSDRTFTDLTANPQSDYWYWVDTVSGNNSVLKSNAASTAPAPLRAAPLKAASPECTAGAVIKNKSVDCGGITLGLSCTGDSDKQPPVITLENASIKNLRISAKGGSDGIHCKSGDCRIENVIWEDICEDAATNLGKTMTIVGGVAHNTTNGPGGKPDKVLQQNSKNSHTIVQGNFTLTGQHGKLWRSCGDCTNNGGPRNLTIISATVNGTIDSIAGVNRNFGDVAEIRDLRIKGYKAGKPKICEEFTGVEKGKGTPTKHDEQWDTKNCKVSRSNVKAL